MHRIYGAFIEIIAASIFIIPLFFLYGKLSVNNLKRTFIYIVFGFYLVAGFGFFWFFWVITIYLLAVLALVGFPSITSMNLDYTINIIPFVDMVSDFVNACLNVLLFIPLGIFLPVLWDKYKDIKNIILVALYLTVGIELSQILTFRTTDINDIITNIAGALLGYYIIRGITKNFTKYIKSNTKNRDLYFICGMVALIMFLFQPFISQLLWEMVL